MDEFVVFLIIGMVSIAAMVIFFSGQFRIGYQPSDSFHLTPTITTTTTTVETIIIEREENLVGPRDVETWRRIDLGSINTSYMSDEIPYNAGDAHLFNGLLFGSNSIEMQIDVNTDNYVGSYLDFDVEKTNSYGILVIRFNGVEIENRHFTPGNHRVIINNSLVKASNKIEIMPSSSYWKIWAPNVYSLKNINFVYDGLKSVVSTKAFNVYEQEYSSLSGSEGKLILDLSEHRGILKIMLNGNEIYSNYSSGYQSVLFDQTYLKRGENNIQFLSDQESLFEGNANTLVYYMTTTENNITRDFEVNSTRFRRLNQTRGKILFNISNVISDGGFSLEIKDDDGNIKTIAYDVVEEDKYTYYFNSTVVSVGTNTATLRSVDDSVFYVKNFKIEI